jgi:hypothetical protein
MIPVPALEAYSELSNCHFQFQKMIQEVSADFWRQKAPCQLFFCFQMTIAQLRIG